MRKHLTLSFLLLFVWQILVAQSPYWINDGEAYLKVNNGDIVQINLPDMKQQVFVSKTNLTPVGATEPLKIKRFDLSDDYKNLLIFTNSVRVWREETRGDYWVLDLKTKKLTQIGQKQPVSTLMFAKFSPDGKKVAYVSERNIYVEDVATGKVAQLTETNGTKKLINGTFDWVYEEEFSCRDGFRWSPDSKKIAYWQIDANQIRDYYMLNTTDSIYPQIVPVEYPKVGERPSPYKIGVVDIAKGKTQWMDIAGDPSNTYIPRMEWANGSAELIVQQLNRKQNETSLLYCDAKSGKSRVIYSERDDAWIDLMGGDMVGYWTWVNGGKSFLWESEKDGWRHLYSIDAKTGSETLLTKGNFDMIEVVLVDNKNNVVYFYASPDNATQRYLYKVGIGGNGNPERVTPQKLLGRHTYQISPNGKYAIHSFTNYFTPREREWITLPDHKSMSQDKPSIENTVATTPDSTVLTEFFQVTTADGVTMDGWLKKPANFDPTKKYPIVFYVYTEPAGATVQDVFGISENGQYIGSMSDDGYIYASLDGRGTPAPKGRAWRKAIYRKIGIVNIRDQAMGATEMFKRWSFIDTSRVAVWGWSGGGSTTLNLLFQYPEIYKTGIAVAAVANQLSYDNIYQERYMGIPQENLEDFLNGSPITHAKNLQGNLLYIHGTGDDNVHYQNAEMLLNELIKYNRQFQFMPYPNRSHGIFEGEGTDLHLSTLYTNYLKMYCPGGGR